MKKFTTLRSFTLTCVALMFGLLGSINSAQAQIYFHNFGTTAITTKPYTGAPGTFDANLSSSSWTTSGTAFAGLGGNGGGTSQALSLSNTSGTPTFTLTFDVNAGYALSVTSFNFWRVRSNTGAQNWSMTINGISVGSGTIPANTGATLGTTSVANAVTGLTGTITVVYTMSGASGTGTARLDDFTLNGTVSPTAINTSVEFVSTSSSVAENSSTTNLALAITNFSTTVATDVTITATGATGRVTTFTSPVTFAANSGSNANCVVTLNNNTLCDGSENVVFTITGISGGRGTPVIGTNDQYTLTITDDEGAIGEVIARQAFDGLVSDTWGINNGEAQISTTAGAGDNPANKRILSGTASWQSVNATHTLNLGVVDVSGYSNKTVTVRVSAVSGNAGNGVDAPDYVQVFANVDGAGFPATADVEVTGNSANVNARWLYTGTQVASTAAGTPITVQCPNPGGTPSTVNGPGTITISIPDGATTLRLRIEAKSGANEIWSVDDIQVTGDRCNSIYYSRGTGNVGNAIWSLNPVGTGTNVTFDRFKSAVVQSGDVVTFNANTRLGDLTVNSGGTLALGAKKLTVSGGTFDIDGTMTAADNSEVVLNNMELVTFESAAALDLFDLTANTPGDVLAAADIRIRGTLLLQDGDFDISLGSMTMVSDANGTGRLGPVSAGASFTGDLTMQRYIPAGATNWRLMGSPVAGQTVNDWKDDFYTAGFPGSNSPGFSNPVGSGILWPSVRWYNETLSYNAIDTGWVGVPNITQPLVQGQGFAAWCGTGLETTTAFTVDMKGAPYVANTPINVPLSYTNNGHPAVDGWNAASNPLASPILFSRIARTSVNDYIWYYNPADGNTAVYDISLGDGTNGGTDTIQSSQAFLVKATATNAQLQFEEADKVEDRVGGFFGGSQVSTFNGIRLKVSSAINTFRDETLVVFGAGAAGRDNEDVEKVTFSHPGAPQIATRTPDGGVIAINAFGAYTTDISIPVMVDVAISGTYTITASGTENIGLSCLVLEDLTTGTMTPMIEGATYSFSMEATDDANAERFVLHASSPVSLNTEAATCNGAANGTGTVVYVGTEPMDITWTNSTGAVVQQQTITEGNATLTGLVAGEYGVEVSSTTACGALSTSFRIEEPAAMEIEASVIDANCPNENGTATVTVLGGIAPFTYQWSNGTSEAALNAAPGEFTVIVSDANGCVAPAVEVMIASGVGPVAMATANATTILVNTEVTFTNTSEAADAYAWDFGDGTTSTDMEPAHAWSIPGTYTVVLTVNDDNCNDTWTTDITVETISNIAAVATAATLNAWFANDKFVVEHSFNNGKPVTIDIMDATGRLHATRQVAGSPARVSIPSEGLNTGIWFVRVTNVQEQRTFRVPLVR